MELHNCIQIYHQLKVITMHLKNKKENSSNESVSHLATKQLKSRLRKLTVLCNNVVWCYEKMNRINIKFSTR